MKKLSSIKAHYHCAFTLLELLVAIAIIAIMASILLPALGKVRERAKGVQCMNNIRQCILASTQYAGDFNGFAPSIYLFPYNISGPNGSISADEVRWAGALYIMGYISNKDSFVCPKSIAVAKTAKPAWLAKDMQVFSYGMTYNYSNTPTAYSSAFVNLYKESDSSRKILFADSVYYMTYSSINKWVSASIITTYDGPPADTSQRAVHLLHSKLANAAYFDGHVSASGAEKFRASGILGGRNESLSPVSF